MVKGTPSKGRRSGKRNHVSCRRCGKNSYHKQKGECASCGFGDTKTRRHYNWMDKKQGKRLK